MRRLPQARSAPRVADRRRAPRDPEGHGAGARDGQPAESVVHERRGPLWGRAVSGERLPWPRPGGNLCGRDPPPSWRRVSRWERVAWRRHLPADPRSRGHARDAPGRRDRPHGAVGADGQSRTADGRQGSASRRSHLRHPAGVGAARHRHLDARRNGAGVRTRQQRTSRRLADRRGRDVARGLARGDQSLRRTSAAGNFLRPEQSNRAVDAGDRAVRGARLCGQGGWLWDTRHHGRRHRSRRDRRSVHVGRGTCEGRQRPDADRARRDADVRSCPSRRHAVSR